MARTVRQEFEELVRWIEEEIEEADAARERFLETGAKYNAQTEVGEIIALKKVKKYIESRI